MPILYLVKYSVKTNIELKVALNVIIEGVKIIAYDDENRLDPSDKWLNRLIFDILIETENIEDAVANSLIFCEFTLALLSLHLATSTDTPLFEKAIDWSPGIRDRDFLQNAILPINLGTTRVFNTDSFSKVFEGLNKTDLSYRNNHPGRIERATRWYRKSISEEDYFSKFSFLWFGLEILNPILIDKYQNEILNHPKKYYHKPDGKENELITLAGIKYLLIEIMRMSYEEWQELLDFRKIIVHGFKPLESIKDQVQNSIPKLETGLTTGIFECIGLEQDIIPELIRPIYPPPSNTEHRFFVKLHNSDLATLGNKKLPHIEVQLKSFEKQVMDKECKTTTKLELNIQNFSEKYTPYESLFMGSIDPEMKRKDFEVETSITPKGLSKQNIQENSASFFIKVRNWWTYRFHE